MMTRGGDETGIVSLSMSRKADDDVVGGKRKFAKLKRNEMVG